MGVEISDLTELTTPAYNDLLVIQDTSTGITKKITPSNANGGSVFASLYSTIDAAIASEAEHIILSPNTTYQTSGNLTPVEGCLIEGPRSAIISLSDNSDASVFTLTNSGIKLKGFKIDGNGSNQSSGEGVHITADNCLVEDIEITDTYRYGIFADDVSETRILKNEIYDTLNIAIFVGTDSSDTEGTIIKDNIVDRTGIAAGSIANGGIHVHGDVSTYTHKGAIISGNRVLMPLNPTSGSCICIEVWGLSDNSIIANNYVYQGNMGISLDLSCNSTVIGNVVLNPKTYGIEIAYETHYCSIVGNTIDGSLNIGIVTDSQANPSTHNIISGNNIINCASYPILLASYSDYTVISGNNIYNKASTNVVAIYLTRSKYVSVTGNVVDGNSTSAQVIRMDWDGIGADTDVFLSVTGNVASNKTGGFLQIFDNDGYEYDYISVVGNVMDNCGGLLAVGGTSTPTWGTHVMAKGNQGYSGSRYDIIEAKNNVIQAWRESTPEASLAAGMGSICHVNTGGAGTSFYVKESGTGNTGWVGK